MICAIVLLTGIGRFLCFHHARESDNLRFECLDKCLTVQGDLHRQFLRLRWLLDHLATLEQEALHLILVVHEMHDTRFRMPYPHARL